MFAPRVSQKLDGEAYSGSRSKAERRQLRHDAALSAPTPPNDRGAVPPKEVPARLHSNDIFPYLKSIQDYSHYESPNKRLRKASFDTDRSCVDHLDAAVGNLASARRCSAVTVCVAAVSVENGTTDRLGVPEERRGLWIEPGMLPLLLGSSSKHRPMPQTTAVNGCVVSHRYKFVYVHVLKSGGMTIKGFLKRALCTEARDGVAVRMPCRSGTDALQVVHCHLALADPAISQSNEYLIWSVVRNPFARVFSAYAMASAFTIDPGISRGKVSMPMTFRDFVVSPQLRANISSLDPVHYRPQHEFLFSIDGCPIVDYVLHLERLDRDMETLLDAINSEELTRYWRGHQRGRLEASTDTDYGARRLHQRSLEDVYDSRDLREHVAREYAKDFDLFAYNPGSIASRGSDSYK